MSGQRDGGLQDEEAQAQTAVEDLDGILFGMAGYRAATALIKADL